MLFLTKRMVCTFERRGGGSLNSDSPPRFALSDKTVVVCTFKRRFLLLTLYIERTCSIHTSIRVHEPEIVLNVLADAFCFLNTTAALSVQEPASHRPLSLSEVTQSIINCIMSLESLESTLSLMLSLNSSFQKIY